MKFRTDLTQARLKELLHYDSETGVYHTSGLVTLLRKFPGLKEFKK